MTAGRLFSACAHRETESRKYYYGTPSLSATLRVTALSTSTVVLWLTKRKKSRN